MILKKYLNFLMIKIEFHINGISWDYICQINYNILLNNNNLI